MSSKLATAFFRASQKMQLMTEIDLQKPSKILPLIAMDEKAKAHTVLVAKSLKKSSKFPILHSECILPPAPVLSTTAWFASRHNMPYQTIAQNKPSKHNTNPGIPQLWQASPIRRRPCPLFQNQPKSSNRKVQLRHASHAPPVFLKASAPPWRPQ